MHARSRKLALAEASSRDEIADAFPPDDAVVLESASFVEETRANERICLGCGGDGSRHEGCDHAEIARLHEPSRAAGEMVARLRRAAAEHRAASRALRALVTSELGRGRAELETTAIPTEAEAAPADLEEEPSPAPEAAAVVPCPRCAEREGEGEVASPPRAARKRARAVIEELESAGVVASPPRAARKRGRAAVDQQSLPFLEAAGEAEKSEAAE